jgi:hypothetical protein
VRPPGPKFTLANLCGAKEARGGFFLPALVSSSGTGIVKSVSRVLLRLEGLAGDTKPGAGGFVAGRLASS